MDVAYSPHRDSACLHLHLHSPSHSHSAYRYQGAHFSSLQQLRRSLSRSPSKPSRFQLRSVKMDVSGSPLSPLALSRAFSPKPSHPPSPVAAQNDTSDAPAGKKRFTLRRTTQNRVSPRTRTTTSRSPRRVLAESPHGANTTPSTSPPSSSGQENLPVAMADFRDKPDTKRSDINDRPIKFEFARSQPTPAASRPTYLTPAQSSPLKRREEFAIFGSTTSETPNPKRRSLHAGFPTSADFTVFQVAGANLSDPLAEETPPSLAQQPTHLFSSPATALHTPMKRASSLKRPAPHRTAANSPRPKSIMDGEFALPGMAASRTRERASLDASSLSASAAPDSLFRRSLGAGSSRGPGMQHRHPLATSQTPGSSSSSRVPSSPAQPPETMRTARRIQPFSKSLPIGAPRPALSQEASAFATPFAFKMAVPPNNAMSTGALATKRNRNTESPQADKYRLPETPSKRHSFPPPHQTDSPGPIKRGSLFETSLPEPDFGTPSIPFSTHSTLLGVSSGKGMGIFGTFGSRDRRQSFHSIHSMDGEDDVNNSPTMNRMMDSQSSADDLPPTPTKLQDNSGRRSKENSLRRKTFGPRASVRSDVFAPSADEALDLSQANRLLATPQPVPQTPGESLTPPDPSRLSISGQHRKSRQSFPFHSSFGSGSCPPMTPTTPRDNTRYFGPGATAFPLGVPHNDVDDSLKQRFQTFKRLEGAEGEFSQVFKVSRPIGKGRASSSPMANQTWIVKRSKKPAVGPMDLKRKLREVKALQALRGNEHVVAFQDHWDHDGHLYIQTEFCEGGNLRKFLGVTGNKGRLDDFRIWKILLELSLGVQAIHAQGWVHLDLKPANVLIDFEGVLKIADFGLACDLATGEGSPEDGDRHYLAPEELYGRYDQPADIFALGCMMTEIAGNCYLPEEGPVWRALRSGEFATVVPSLTWSEESATLSRDVNGNPMADPAAASMDSLPMSDSDNHPVTRIRTWSGIDHKDEVARAPAFMINPMDVDALDHVVQRMLDPDPDTRPTARQIYELYGCQWVRQRRRAGATIYEGNFGPSPDLLSACEPDPDAMDMS